jgi:hypothetical protein
MKDQTKIAVYRSAKNRYIPDINRDTITPTSMKYFELWESLAAYWKPPGNK